MKIKFICIKFMTYCNLLGKEIKKKIENIQIIYIKFL